MVKKYLNNLYGKLIGFCVKYRLGKTKTGARIIFKILDILSGFIIYTNTYQPEARGHFVPQFILKRFRITDNKSRLGFINSYTKSTKQFGEEKAKDCAQEPDFYVFRDKKGDSSDFAEKRVYGFLENFCSLIFENIHTLNSAIQFTFLETSIITTFIAHQMCRTPKFYKELEKYILYLIEQKGFFINKLFVDNKTISLEAVTEYITKNYYNITVDALENYVPRSKLRGKDFATIIKSIGSRIANAIAEILGQKEIIILDAKKQNLGLFVISDNPVVLLDVGNKVLEFPAWWRVSDSNIFIFLPISPDKAIFLTNTPRRGGNYEDREHSLIELCNFGQFIGSDSKIYSNNKLFLEKCSTKFKNY